MECTHTCNISKQLPTSTGGCGVKKKILEHFSRVLWPYGLILPDRSSDSNNDVAASTLLGTALSQVKRHMGVCSTARGRIAVACVQNPAISAFHNFSVWNPRTEPYTLYNLCSSRSFTRSKIWYKTFYIMLNVC